MAQPLDHEYLAWGDIAPSANENPVIKVGRKFASSMDLMWGEWLGYEGTGSADDKPVVTTAGGQFCTNITDNGGWNDPYAGATGEYPWFLLSLASQLLPSSTDETTLDLCGKTDAAKNYQKSDTGQKINIRRAIINRQLNDITDTCFSIIVYRFIKAEMGRYIRNYIENIPTEDRDLPQPELLLYLYEYMSYLSDLKSEKTLAYLYSRVPEIFFPYRSSFITTGGTPGHCKKDKPEYRVEIYVLQQEMGIIENTNYESPMEIPSFGGEGREPSTSFSYSSANNYGSDAPTAYLSGLEWWSDQFKKRLPDSFLTPQSIAYWIKFDTGMALEEHLEEFNYTYESYSYDWNDPVDSLRPGLQRPADVDSAEILDWWEELIEVIEDQGTFAQKTQQALKEEKEDIENLDLEQCQTPIPSPPPISKCGFCTPNLEAQVPDWTKRTANEPFLNERTCRYSIAMLTNHESPGNANNLVFLMADQITPGIKKLLNFHGKDDSSNTINELISFSRAEDYFVPTRPNLKIKVLVTVDADPFHLVPSKEKSSLAQEEELESDSLAPQQVVLKSADIRPYFRRLQGALLKYNLQYDLDTFSGNSPVYPGLNFYILRRGVRQYKTQLIKFLRTNKFQINPMRKNIAKLDKVTLNFENDFELAAMLANKMGCPEEAITAGIEEFKQQSPISNPTISALVSHLPDIIQAMTASEPLKWEDFARQYVYPSPMPPSSPHAPPSPGEAGENCNLSQVMYNINKPIIAIGTQAFGQILTYPQLVSQQLGSQICYSLEDRRNNDLKLDTPAEQWQRQKDLWARQLNAADSVFKNLPSILDEEIDNLNDFFTKLLDKLGICGMAALLEEAINCIGAGLGLEVSAKSALNAFINNATDKQLQSLFFELNPGLRDLIKNSVKELTEIPLPWETSYRAGSYNGAGVTYAVQFTRERKEALATLGITLEEETPQYEEVEELLWPDDCADQENGEFFGRPGDPYKYLWTDYDNLYYEDTRTGATGLVTLSNLSPTSTVFDCRPQKILVKKSLTNSSEETE